MRGNNNLLIVAALVSLSIPAYAAQEAQTDRCAAINALAAAGDEASSRELAAAVNDPDPEIQSCAIRAAGEAKNEAAADALLGNVETYQQAARSRGPFEENLKAKLKALDSIWSLGEIGTPRVMARLMKIYKGADDVVKINIAVGAGKNGSSATADFLYGIAANTAENNVVRAAAYEMLENRRLGRPAPQLSRNNGMEKGDIIFTGGLAGITQPWVGDLPVGHVGLYGGTEVRNGRIVVVIYDCVPDNFKPYGGVRRIYSFSHFTSFNKYAFYGNRVSRVRPTAAQRDRIIKAAASKLGHHYNDTHLTQKGPDVFDCVGYAEYSYESAGLNPTPNDQETGWGWPLTPAEQFAATVPNSRATRGAAGSITLPAREIALPQQAIADNGAAALQAAFGAAQPLASADQDIHFKPAD